MRNAPLRSFAVWVKGLSICLLVTFVFAAGVLAQTQSTTGNIQGTVLDANGAALPGAGVEIRNNGTNRVLNLTTDEDGRFVALQLQPGRYNITVSKQGFATLVVEKADLTVGQALNLPLSMKVSSVQETVTITATPTVDTVKTESSTTLGELTVDTTPILGRKFEDLLTLTPGVSVVQGPDGDEISFAGQRGIFNNVSLDGGDYNNGFFGEQAGGQRAAIDIPLDAVKEFQVVATGASAEFGRTAGGVINVVSKSGTNQLHGSVFYFQRGEALTANTSDGKPLTDFHREQFGGTVGGPIKKDKSFFFFAFEGVHQTLTRDNLSAPIGTPCSVTTPTIQANEAQIIASPDCQRLALINFFKVTRNQDEGLPVQRPIRNYAALGKIDWNLNNANKLAVSYNFDYSKNTNETFDVATYGNSANGIEGPSQINNLNVNLFTTLSPTTVNEAHFTYARETRPRSAVPSNIPADTGIGFSTTFRFGNPFFLGPTVDELIWRTQVKDSISLVRGNHTFKLGGEWLHTLNDQVFRGFFEGRYIFDSVNGFLRYATPGAPGSGFGPNAGRCTNGAWTDLTLLLPPCSGATTPLLLFLQGAAPNGPATDATGASNITNQDYALFAQDTWHVLRNVTLSYGLRWEAQIFPKPVVAPAQTAYGVFLNDPRFPSDGTLHNQTKEFQPRLGLAWNIGGKGKSVFRASYNIYYGRQNMLSQVGSITTNGVQQQTIAGGLFANPGIRPTWPGLVAPTASTCGPPANPFPCFSGVRVFSNDYANPRIYTANFGFEQELVPNLAMYFDFTWSQAVHLTRFVNINNGGTPLPITPTTNQDQVSYSFPGPFNFDLGDVFVTSSSAKSLYRGFTVGVRKRFSHGFQLDANYVRAKDLDDDSNERDPFTDRSFNRFDFSKDYSVSDRDTRNAFNFYTYTELPAGFRANFRIQARSAQPITDNTLGDGSGLPCSQSNSRTRIVNGIDCGRNHLRKDNQYFSFDWRLMRPFNFGERYQLIPIVEMFNTFNGANNVNPLSAPALFNFDGFLRQGVGNPRELQLAVKFTF